MDVGVRELKARLSEYLDRASRGEVIRVTERGVPKAVLGPMPGRFRLEDGIAEGWIRPGDGTAPTPTIPRARGRMRTEEAIGEDRGD